MGQRGRPKNPERSVRITLSGRLHPEYDADILAWLNAIPIGQRMNALKTALRSGGLGQAPSLSSSQPDESQTAAEALLANWDF